MTTNPYNEELKVRKFIDKVLNSKQTEFDLIQLKKQILLLFAVSETMINKFITTFYIETGAFELKKGILYRN